LFFPQRNWGNFWTKCKKNLDVNSTTFAKIFMGKNRRILDITKLGKTQKKKKTHELGMKKINNVSTR
jgi:hypothetical protein